jgi:hypothetical protein
VLLLHGGLIPGRVGLRSVLGRPPCKDTRSEPASAHPFAAIRLAGGRLTVLQTPPISGFVCRRTGAELLDWPGIARLPASHGLLLRTDAPL